MSRVPRPLLALLALGALTVAFWWPCLVGGQTPLLGDAQRQMEPWRTDSGPGASRPVWDHLLWDGVAQFAPWRSVGARCARRGEVPLWNPHQFCGAPLLANGQSAFFYPPNCLFWLLDVRYALGLTAALHYLLAAAGCWLLAREIGLGHAAGCLAGVAFAFGGFMAGWTELPTLMNVATWLPWAVLGTERLFRGHRAGFALLVAGLALALLAGHYQIAAYVWLTAGLHVAARLLYRFNARRLAVLLAFPLAAGLAAVQLLPSLELARLSARGGARPTEEGFAFNRERALAQPALRQLWDPNYLGTPAEWRERGEFGVSSGDELRVATAYPEWSCFVGRAALLCALLALVLVRRPVVWFLAGTAAVALLVALGTPLARLLYFGVPGLGQAGGFGRILCVYTLAVAMLAACGADALTRRLRWVAGRPGVGPTLRTAAPHAAKLLALVAAVELVPFARGLVPLSSRSSVYAPSTPLRLLSAGRGEGRALEITPRSAWRFAPLPAAVAPPNTATIYGYDSVQGYDSLRPRLFEQLAVRADGAAICPPINGNMVLLENAESPALREAGVNWVLTERTLDPRVWTVVWGDSLRLYRRRDPAPRAWLEGRTREPAPYTATGANAVRVTVPGDRGGDLVVPDLWFPGWRAYVDGQRTEIALRAPCFRRVRCSPGSREVVMVYMPATFAAGAFTTATALAACAAAGAAGWAGRRRVRAVPGQPRRGAQLT